MKRIFSFFKKFRLGQILTVFMVGVTLFLTTACNSGDVRGARPDNPPVQMGGQNNPHKVGGDGYTDYQMSTDPAIKRQPSETGDRAQLPIHQLIARVESDASDLLYPGSDATRSSRPDVGVRESQAEFRQEATQIPAAGQPVIDRSDPDAQLLEKAGKAFQDASSFLNDTAQSASEQPELQRIPD